MFLFKRKNGGKTVPDLNKEATDSSATPFWHQTLPGETYNKWPKKDGQPEEPVFLKHCTSVDMEDEMLINMLAAYDIPAVRIFPSNGSFGKVVLGMSGEGANIFVPVSKYAEAAALLEESPDE
ncbi:MAG: hypothetical protein EOM51_05405 [Clostridia bacterium]|nr:hypothetical protein [Clostridia bacterium]